MAKCPQCSGKGWRHIITGPMLLGGQAFPGGKRKFDCEMCEGRGTLSKQQLAKKVQELLDKVEKEAEPVEYLYRAFLYTDSTCKAFLASASETFTTLPKDATKEAWVRACIQLNPSIGNCLVVKELEEVKPNGKGKKPSKKPSKKPASNRTATSSRKRVS